VRVEGEGWRGEKGDGEVMVAHCIQVTAGDLGGGSESLDGE